MREITDIIVHEADTPTGKEFFARDIDSWHVERGFKRTASWIARFNPDFKAIGYHYVIDVSGLVETGRHADEVGAHCQGHNANSIGICLIGKGKYNSSQWASLQVLLEALIGKYPGAVIRGHRQYDSAIAQGKTCPDFNVEQYVAHDCVPDLENIA
jgi:N-acetylmuramoyl-L-alanine amidase